MLGSCLFVGGSLKAKELKVIYISVMIRCLWTVKSPISVHLGWRAIRKLRDLVMSFIKFEVGDEKTIFSWHDNWHPIRTWI